MNDIIEVPIFYGDDPEKWISWIDIFCFDRGFSDFEKVQFAYGFVEGDALTWFNGETSRSPFSSWGELKLRLFKRFGNRFLESEELLERTQDFKEERKISFGCEEKWFGFNVTDSKDMTQQDEQKQTYVKCARQVFDKMALGEKKVNKKKFKKGTRFKHKCGKPNLLTPQIQEENKWRKRNNKALLKQRKLVSCYVFFNHKMLQIRFVWQFRKKKMRTRVEKHQTKCIKPNQYGNHNGGMRKMKVKYERKGIKHELLFAKLFLRYRTYKKMLAKWKKNKFKWKRNKFKLKHNKLRKENKQRLTLKDIIKHNIFCLFEMEFLPGVTGKKKDAHPQSKKMKMFKHSLFLSVYIFKNQITCVPKRLIASGHNGFEAERDLNDIIQQEKTEGIVTISVFCYNECGREAVSDQDKVLLINFSKKSIRLAVKNTRFRIKSWYSPSVHPTIKRMLLRALFRQEPFELVKFELDLTTNADLKEQLQRKHAMLTLLKEHLRRVQQRMKGHVDSHHRDVQFRLFFHRGKDRPVAYHLKLPPDTKIYNTFHASQPKKVMGDLLPLLTLPSQLQSDRVFQAESEVALGSRVHPKTGHEELLIQWKDLPVYECSWELRVVIAKQFPNFNLEDKVDFEDRGIDRYKASHPPTIYNYARRRNKVVHQSG